MKMKTKRIVGLAIVTVLAATFIIWLIWMPITTSWMVRDSAKRFHDRYQPGKKMYACIHEDEFALGFAGTKGLPEIEKLSRDDSLIPSARNTASNLYAYVSSGQHLPSIRHTLANNPYWIGRQLNQYLLKRDTAFLKSRGVVNLDESIIHGDPWTDADKECQEAKTGFQTTWEELEKSLEKSNR